MTNFAFKICFISSLDINSRYYKRLAYDEILSNLLVLSQVRKRIKKLKKVSKKFEKIISNQILKSFNFNLTIDQSKAIDEINNDLNSNFKMFRILQGDVGSGKTIVAFLAIANVISSKYQAVMMAPTEILAKQHYELSLKNLAESKNIVYDFFDNVMVNDENKAIKKNRLELLHMLCKTYENYLNFSSIESL